MTLPTIIYTATDAWLRIAEGQGLAVDWDSDPVDADAWPTFCRAAGFDADDGEVGFGTLITPRSCDAVLQAGDVVASQGPGGDIVFLR